ncbi:MAG TPA: adenylyltransferase/cytidyltransferase family protein, partial [Gammaproteobacteria bacterium]
MRLYRNLHSLRRAGERQRAVTVGAYDGLHLGHQEILTQLREHGRSQDLSTLVLSFEPMPKEFFSPLNPPARLTRFRERYDILEAVGIDEFFCPRFSSIRNLTPDAFMQDLLVDGLGTRHVVVGDDFRFAAQRLGTIDDL